MYSARMRPHDWKEFALVAVLGLAGFALFLTRHPDLQPTSRISIEVDRHEASQLAEAHLRDLGYHSVDLRVENVSFRTDHAWSSFLHTEGIDRDGLVRFRPEAWWEVLFRHAGTDEIARVRVAPDGDVFWVQHPVVPGGAGPRLTDEETQAMAATFFRDVVELPLTGWTLEESRVNQLPARSDHTLIWRRNIEGAPGSSRLLRLVIAGDQVASWSRTVELSDEFQAQFTPQERVHAFMDFGILILVTLVWLTALVVFALRFRTGEIGIRNGFLLVFGLLMLFIWWAFNTAPYSIHAAMVDADSPFTVMFIYIGIGVQIFFTAVGLFFVWNAGESVAREVWPAKLAPFDKLFAQRFFTADIGWGILRGAAMAAIFNLLINL